LYESSPIFFEAAQTACCAPPQGKHALAALEKWEMTHERKASQEKRIARIFPDLLFVDLLRSTEKAN
jgi:hypothetical protein